MGVTNAGLAGFTGIVTGDVTAPTYLAMGTGATAYAATQTALVTEITGSSSGLARTAAAVSRVTTTASNDTLKYLKTYTVVANTNPTEVGLFNDATTGTMFQRALFSPAPTLLAGDAYTLVVTVKLV